MSGVGEAIIAGGWQSNNQQDYWAALDKCIVYLLERSNGTKKKLTDDIGCILINATYYGNLCLTNPSQIIMSGFRTQEIEFGSFFAWLKYI